MRRRVTAGIAAVAAVALSVAAGSCASTGAPDGTSLIVGYYGPSDQIAIVNRTIEGGTYLITVGASVQFFSSEPDALLECGLVDASGRIGYLDDSLTPVPPTGRWTRVSSTAVYEVPEITVGIRCIPNGAGSIGVGYRDAVVVARPVG